MLTQTDALLVSPPQRGLLSAHTADYHRELLARASRSGPSATPASNPDTPLLMSFNGYYTLGNAPGAFFAIDTNVTVTAAQPAPQYDLSLIVSLDGTSATRYAFTGTFDGTTLSQSGGATGLSVQLTLARTTGGYGPVATCTGTITLPGSQTPVSVSGSTYNNPIPASLFAGTYSYTPSGSTTPVNVMYIGSNNELLYDYGSNDGTLLSVANYAYNMNMYYFSFSFVDSSGNDFSTALIMGTAAVQGFACNDMTSLTSDPTSPSNTPTSGGNPETTRFLLTLPGATVPKIELYDLSGVTLADFSGYYPITNLGKPGAFVSIQAQYATLVPGTSLDLTFVMISVSMDGMTSQGYYFNPSTMSFDGTTLTMPAQGITLTFDRAYDAANGSLVSLSGTVGTQAVSGYTLFNPVPLSVFGGVTMTNGAGDSLTVNNDNSVTYNQTVMDAIIYVPLMYILAYPVDNPTVVMSFGTSGTSGNTCIVTTNANTPSPTVAVVSAIPPAQSTSAVVAEPAQLPKP